MNKLINLLLLVVMFFSIAHGVVLEDDLATHCSVQEYVAEFSAPSTSIEHYDKHHEDHDNELCETHFMFHISFLLPQNFSLFETAKEKNHLTSSLLINLSHYKNNTFRPPIA